jgi:hypothetical protein
MGMSTHVIGFVPPDAEWKAKKLAYDSCKAAGVDPPTKLQDFFGWSVPDEHGREADLGDSLREWRDDYRQGYEVEIAKLPQNVKVLRFYNSW